MAGNVSTAAFALVNGKAGMDVLALTTIGEGAKKKERRSRPSVVMVVVLGSVLVVVAGIFLVGWSLSQCTHCGPY